MVDGYYYLHENGSLIYKTNSDSGQVADFRDSDLVKHFWSIDTGNRFDAWQILIEADALDADKERIKELAELWHCDDNDALIYAMSLGFNLYKDGSQWCATRSDAIDLQESPSGFGITALEAMSSLAKDLGFKASKLWGASFADLVKVRKSNEG